MSDRDTHLSEEEIAFLRRMFSEDERSDTGVAESPAGRSVMLDTSHSDAEVLASLIGADSLTLTARQDGFLFRFELTVYRPPGGHPVEIRFGYPRILEQQGRERAARIQPRTDEVALESAEGISPDALVRDISASGLSLTDSGRGRRRRNERVRLRLRLGKGEHTQVEGRIVRVQRGISGTAEHGRRTLGIEFEHADPQTRAMLDRFVFQHHPKVHH